MIYLSDICTCTCMYKMDGEEYNEIVNTLMRERRGGSSGGCVHPAHGPPPPEIGKNIIFWRKIVIFTRNYPKNFRVSLNRDFSHEILQKCSRLPPLGAIFLSVPPVTIYPLTIFTSIQTHPLCDLAILYSRLSSHI